MLIQTPTLAMTLNALEPLTIIPMCGSLTDHVGEILHNSFYTPPDPPLHYLPTLLQAGGLLLWSDLFILFSGQI